MIPPFICLITIGTLEATECFFAITKLFQSQDPVLRRMVYLGIKCLAPMSEDVIIVTSSLTKGSSKSSLHFPNSGRDFPNLRREIKAVDPCFPNRIRRITFRIKEVKGTLRIPSKI